MPLSPQAYSHVLIANSSGTVRRPRRPKLRRLGNDEYRGGEQVDANYLRYADLTKDDPLFAIPPADPRPGGFVL